MYRCKECNAEYTKKPDYCSCGNDVFEEIKETNSIKQDSAFKRNLPSIVFLVFCIILSFAIIFIFGNPKNENIQKDSKVNKQEIVLPNIEDIWNDEKPRQPIAKQDTTKVAKISKVELKKEPAKIIKTAPINPPKKQDIQKPIQKVATQPKQATSNQQSAAKNTVIQQHAPAIQPIQTQTNSINQQPQNIQVPASQTINKEELKQYKKALRNKIASNIDFLNVAGDGNCVLSFNISSSGALLNRKFVTQSQNTSLNDAVYSAMLQVSTFKAPPSTYKNETIRLTVQISGGNFSVSLE